MEGASESDRARYVAIITDGNGRWAEREGVSVEEGHRGLAIGQDLLGLRFFEGWIHSDDGRAQQLQSEIGNDPGRRVLGQ